MNQDFPFLIYFESPLGLIAIKATDTSICQILFTEEKTESENLNNILIDCKLQLQKYFNGTLRQFSINVQPEGTTFQKQVWNALQQIPFGKTVSYAQISKAIHNDKSIRAVGAANGQNPVAIIIPCHRVIGSDGSLTGYAGGLWRKHWLLEHEQRIASGVQKLF